MKKSKVWFITGASRGFGLEIVKAALANGDQVAATVRSKPEALLAQFNNDKNLFVTILDVTDEKQAKEAVKQAVEQFGRIDVLVNNAGYGFLGALEEVSDEEVRKNFDVNVFGTLNVLRAGLPILRGQRSGHVINFSSVAGLRGAAGWGVYNAAKFAVVGLTEALAKEMAPLGVHVTVVEPGPFRTDFLDQSSLLRAANVITDYEQTVGKTQESAGQRNKKQPGDPKKLADAMISIVNAENPPVHLPLGKDTISDYRSKLAAFGRDVEAWKDIVFGSEFDE